MQPSRLRNSDKKVAHRPSRWVRVEAAKQRADVVRLLLQCYEYEVERSLTVQGTRRLLGAFRILRLLRLLATFHCHGQQSFLLPSPQCLRVPALPSCSFPLCSVPANSSNYLPAYLPTYVLVGACNLLEAYLLSDVTCCQQLNACVIPSKMEPPALLLISKLHPRFSIRISPPPGGGH